MHRSYAAADFPPARVLAAKRDRRISVCLPARDEEATIGAIVTSIGSDLMTECPVVDELVVIDDGSVDATATVATAAGARVVAAGGILPEYGTDSGKGQAMWRGVHVTSGDVVVFCDADIRSFDTGFVLGLVGPLLEDDALSFVKGFYQRPLDGQPGGGGRVTELMARPLMALLFEELGFLAQPLAGECAARRDVLEAVPFVGGYGVDLGLLIDVSARFGQASIAQSDLGERIHRNRTLAELSAQSLAILQLGLARRGYLESDLSTTLTRPDGSTVEVALTQRPPLRDLAARRKTA